MRIPLSWLKSFVSTALSTTEIAKRLTMAGLEVEAIDPIGAYDTKVVWGSVTACHNADPEHPSVSVLTMNIGHSEPITIVTTAPVSDLPKDARLAVALPGVHLIDQSGVDFAVSEVTESKRNGHVSEGVLCSTAELGVGTNAESLFSTNQPHTPGTPVIDTLSPTAEWEADEVLEIAILANIARCQSIRGVARELAALIAAPLTEPDVIIDLPKDITLNPVIASPETCKRFSLGLIEHVRVVRSPRWLQRWLVLCDVTPINNLVDITNYVMLECGQPMHAYDADKLIDFHLSADISHAGDTLLNLAQEADDTPAEILLGHPVIRMQDQVVALAGVIGGKPTAISDTTRCVLLEAANFDFIAIRRSQQAHKRITESSLRFSRGVDPQLTLYAIQRYLTVLKATCPELSCDAIGDSYDPCIFETRTIQLSRTRTNRALGTNLSLAEMAALLERLQLSPVIEAAEDCCQVTVNAARRDLESPCDLMEEIARVYGYDNLPGTMPIEPLATHPRNVIYEKREHLREMFASIGLQEIISYSMTSITLEAKLLQGSEAEISEHYVRLANPISEDRAVLRRTLSGHMLQHISENLRYQNRCAFFEIGKVFHPEVSGYHPLLPSEPYRLSIALTGNQTTDYLTEENRPADFYDLRAVLDALFAKGYLQHRVRYVRTAGSPFHPGQCAEIFIDDHAIGKMGTVHPLVSEAFQIKQSVFLAELDLDALLSIMQETFAVKPLPLSPSISIDISVVVSEDLPASAILETIETIAGSWLEDRFVFDVYRDSAALGESKKALAIRFVLNAKDRTFKMEEATALREKIVSVCTEKFGAVLRAG